MVSPQRSSRLRKQFERPPGKRPGKRRPRLPPCPAATTAVFVFRRGENTSLREGHRKGRGKGNTHRRCWRFKAGTGNHAKEDTGNAAGCRIAAHGQENQNRSSRKIRKSNCGRKAAGKTDPSDEIAHRSRACSSAPAKGADERSQPAGIAEKICRSEEGPANVADPFIRNTRSGRHRQLAAAAKTQQGRQTTKSVKRNHTIQYCQLRYSTRRYGSCIGSGISIRFVVPSWT